MTEPVSVRDSFERFRKRSRDLLDLDDSERLEAVRLDAYLGIGVLVGGGFPGAAAAFAYLLKRDDPDAQIAWLDDEADA